jgi:hypothetical protein
MIKFKINDIKPKTYLKYKEFLLIVREVIKSSSINQALKIQRELI